MSGRVYMRAEMNEAGVTVAVHGELVDPTSGKVDPAIVIKTGWGETVATDAEARAVVEGLLRRMLERDESAAAHLFVADVWDRWNRREGR